MFWADYSTLTLSLHLAAVTSVVVKNLYLFTQRLLSQIDKVIAFLDHHHWLSRPVCFAYYHSIHSKNVLPSSTLAPFARCLLSALGLVSKLLVRAVLLSSGFRCAVWDCKDAGSLLFRNTLPQKKLMNFLESPHTAQYRRF
jgi:hypothetical protein